MPEQIPWRPPDDPTPAWNPPPKVWETGEAPDDSRVPGTRRLWLAGGLAVGVLVASVSAIAMQDRESANGAADRNAPAAADEPLLPDVSLPAPAPSAKTGLSSPQATPSEKGTSEEGTSEKQQGGAKGAGSSNDGASSGDADGDDPGDDDNKGKKGKKGKSPAPSDRKSVRSVNFPDRHWQVSDGFVRLAQVGESSPSSAREDSSFRVVKGLAKASCHSFVTADGTYLRHRHFVLRAERNDGSNLFRQDATFCPRPAYGSSGVMLEAVNYPGRFLRHRSFTLRLEGYDRSQSYWKDSAFKLVDGLA